MGVPHPIPYQGSKRGLASAILGYFPPDTERVIEPFVGSAALSLAAAYHGKASSFVLNDLNAALIRLWDEIINRPDALADAYAALWHQQQGREREYYDQIRTHFNKVGRADHFLYLLARCVKASVRYNTYGEFNQSPDNRRKGTHPDTMREHIVGASRLLCGKTQLSSVDYEEVVAYTTWNDVVYMDPPYQGVCEGRDPRYLSAFSYSRFVDVLRELNRIDASYIVSYDGRTGPKTFGKPLPQDLELIHIELDAGRSSQATLLGRSFNTIESLYLSPALAIRISTRSTSKVDYEQGRFSLAEASL